VTGKGLTESVVLETVYKSDESFRNSSNDSVSSSDNETDDTAVADAVINDNSGDEDCTKIACGRLRITTEDPQNYTIVILDPEMVQKI
jgi:hypothetical protein